MKIVDDFQELRKILCICPDCGTILRVSDLKLKIKGVKTKTWLDDFEDKLRVIEKKEQKFEEIKDELRQKAVEKGRLEALKVFNKAIDPSLRTLKIDAFDMKPILNPVDFVIFKDMNKEEVVNDIIFLSKTIKNNELNKLRAQVKNVIQKKEYNWQEARIDENGSLNIE